MSPVIQKQTSPPSNSTMAFQFNKKGRILEAKVRVKDATVKADVDIVFLFLAAVMISLINIVYLFGIL